MKVTCELIIDLPGLGGEWQPDDMCRTILWTTGVEPWLVPSSPCQLTSGEVLPQHPVPSPFIWPAFAAGQPFNVQIPSGTFEGTVRLVVPCDEHGREVFAGYEHASVTQQRVTIAGVWTGKYNGLFGAGCAFGPWTAYVRPDALVETSLCAEPVRWDMYEAARYLATVFRDIPDTSDMPDDPDQRAALYAFASSPEYVREKLRLALGGVVTVAQALREQTLTAALAPVAAEALA